MRLSLVSRPRQDSIYREVARRCGGRYYAPSGNRWGMVELALPPWGLRLYESRSEWRGSVYESTTVSSMVHAVDGYRLYLREAGKEMLWSEKVNTRKIPFRDPTLDGRYQLRAKLWRSTRLAFRHQAIREGLRQLPIGEYTISMFSRVIGPFRFWSKPDVLVPSLYFSGAVRDVELLCGAIYFQAAFLTALAVEEPGFRKPPALSLEQGRIGEWIPQRF